MKYKLLEIQRFTKYIQLDILSGCWIWKGNLNPDGYGVIKIKGKGLLAHRFSYEYYNDKIKEGLTIDHLCRNKACVNPQHLEPVTLQENIKRGLTGKINHRNTRKAYCIHGHEFNEENTYYHKEHRTCRICKAVREKKYRREIKNE